MIFKGAWSNAGYIMQSAQWMVASNNNINKIPTAIVIIIADRLHRFSAQHPPIPPISFISHGVKGKVSP